MQGFPKHIGTKEDIQNLLIEFPEQIKRYLQILLDERFQWVLLSEHPIDEDLVPSNIQKVSKTKDFNGTMKQLLFEWQKQESFLLSRLNMTVEECVLIGCEDREIPVPSEEINNA